MDIVELLPRLHFLRFPVGHVYLWEDPEALTLIDTGVPGSGTQIVEAIRSLGRSTQDVRRIVLTISMRTMSAASPVGAMPRWWRTTPTPG